jgi:hypothetical protein
MTIAEDRVGKENGEYLLPVFGDETPERGKAMEQLIVATRGGMAIRLMDIAAVVQRGEAGRATMLFDVKPRVAIDPRREERLIFARAPYVQPGT